MLRDQKLSELSLEEMRWAPLILKQQSFVGSISQPRRSCLDTRAVDDETPALGFQSSPSCDYTSRRFERFGSFVDLKACLERRWMAVYLIGDTALLQEYHQNA